MPRHRQRHGEKRSSDSTPVTRYETRSQTIILYTCNICELEIESLYHCTVCDDFDICVPCYKKKGHPHKMDKLEIDIDGTPRDGRKQANPREHQDFSIRQQCTQSLVHACQCRDAKCRLPSCQKMKRVVTHSRSCKRFKKGDCPICKQLIPLCCYHARNCKETKCPVPFCSSVNQNMKESHALLQQQQRAPVPETQLPTSEVHAKALQQLRMILNSPTSPNQQQEILKLFISNLTLKAEFLKQRQNSPSQEAAAGGCGGVGGPEGVDNAGGSGSVQPQLEPVSGVGSEGEAANTEHT